MRNNGYPKIRTLFVSFKIFCFCTLQFFFCISCSRYNIGQENAVWSESIYFRGYKPSSGKELDDDILLRYAKTLESNKIKYAYIFAGPYQKDGHLPKYSFSDLAKRSIKKLKQYYPDIQILPWIGGVQNRTVYLGDSIWVENALRDTERLVEELGVPGIHIDFEYILKGNPYLDTTIGEEKPNDERDYGKNVNLFHKKLRELLPRSFISSVVVSTAPDTKPWKRKTTLDELSELIKYVNQLSFLYYDTYINSQEVFEKNCKDQIEDIQFLKQFGTDTQFLLAIGTFVNRQELQGYRNLKIESIPNTLKIIKKSTKKIDQLNILIDGIAIFCDWETDKNEWRAFYSGWVKN